VELAEADGSESILLNDYLGSSGAVIKELQLVNSLFSIQAVAGPQTFSVRVFKLLFPRNKVSKVSLVAHKARSHGNVASELRARVRRRVCRTANRPERETAKLHSQELRLQRLP
jgi:hypothetical protein